ncbi:MAG TPA: glycosyltransferase family 39 protein [Gemmatimonadaceae bacterium]|nr:glycosyltransferase family 39 protein [Gemmatimonadaceae bacterium]
MSSSTNGVDVARARNAANRTPASDGHRARIVAALAAAAALALPPSATAAAIVAMGGGGANAMETLRAGVWLLKLALLLTAAAIALTPTWLPARATRAVSRSAAPSRVEAIVVIGLVLTGAALRLHDLGDGLWIDEIYTLVDYVRTPMARILTTVDSQNQHMLYSALARVAHDLIADERTALRLPAALFGVASLYATWRFSRAITGTGEAILATALLTMSYHHVWFSQNARGYTGLLLFTLLGTTCLIRLLEGSSRAPRRDAWLYALWMALATYVHVTAALSVVGHVLVIAIAAGRDPALRVRERLAPLLAAPVLAGLLSLLLYAIVLPQLLEVLLVPTMPETSVEWQSVRWMVAETLQSLGGALPGGLVTVGLAGVVLLTGIASYWRQAPATLLAMLLPGLVTAVAVVAMQHNLWPRFFFFSAAFAVVLAVRGGVVLCRGLLGYRHGSTLAWTGGALLVAGSALTLPRAWAPKQDFEGAVAFVDAARRPGDTVIALDLVHGITSGYLGRDWPGASSRSEMESLESRDARTWALYTFPIRLRASHPAIFDLLEREYTSARRFDATVGGGDVVVMMREPSSAADHPDSSAFAAPPAGHVP